jgi:hypothetical protein
MRLKIRACASTVQSTKPRIAASVLGKQVKKASVRAEQSGEQHPSNEKGRSSWKRWFAVAFVSFHVVAIFLFALPINIWPARIFRELTVPYMRCIGMTETWDMFAPNPKSEEQFLKAIVVTKSGQTEIYSFPRMEDLPLGERYGKERYRKFSESVLCNDCAALWPDIEKGIARREAIPNDPPDKVILVKFASPIDPKTGSLGSEAAAKPTVLTELFVRPEDLR